MKRTIEISNSDKSLRAVIDPYTGAMLTHVFVDGRACLRYFYDKTAIGVTEAGGNPVLFPFPSSTSADGYVVDGKTYYMPFHGLVMNAVFKVEEKSKSRVLLSITSNESWKASAYPYDFKLWIEYKISGKNLYYNTTIENLSDVDLPHYFGTHTYFLASDKKNFKIVQHCQTHLGPDGKPTEMTDFSDLSVPLDDLYINPTKFEFDVTSEADGYTCHCEYSKEFACNVIWNGGLGAVCVEPWCGLPDSINRKDYIQYVKPGQKQKLTFKYQFKAI